MRNVSQQKTRAMCTKTKALQIGNLPESPFTFPSFTDKVGRRDASSLATIVLLWVAPSNWTPDVAEIQNRLPPSNWFLLLVQTRRGCLSPTSFRLHNQTFAKKVRKFLTEIVSRYQYQYQYCGMQIHIFIGPRYTWGPIYRSESL